MRQRRERIGMAVVTTLLALSILAILAFGNGSAARRVLREHTTYQELDNLRLELRDTAAYAGVEKTYTAVLPELSAPDENLWIYLVHQYAEVWLDDTPVAVSREADGWHIGRSPGCYWFSIPVSAADSGRTLRIVTQPVYGVVAKRDPTVIVADWESVLSAQTNSVLPQLVMGVFCVGASLVLLLFSSSVPESERERKQMRFLGAFSMCVALWRLCDLRLMPLIFARQAALLYIVSVLALLLIPVFFTRFLYWRSAGEGEMKLYRLLCMLFTVDALVIAVLHLLGLMDLRALLYVILAGDIVVLVPVLAQSLLNLVRGRGDAFSRINNGVYIAFAVAATVDMLRYLYVRRTINFSILICVTVLHLLYMSWLLITEVRRQHARIYESEMQLAEGRARLMISQIQPHFIFNALGVIRELCHSDPAKAETATVKFSEYLRQVMDAMEMDRPIRFTDELRHTMNYLDLEKLRFGDALRVEYDIRAMDFRLPALTLQPIVENAVRHGIRKKLGGGTVRIESRAAEDAYIVTVRDDGPGFDTAAEPADGQSHLGIKNVRRRLEFICGGRLEIESTIGEGACAVISIPREGSK